MAIAGRLARRQQGMVARQQLLAASISRHVIDRWIQAGFLHRVHPGVYAVGHLALAPFGPEAAALLACGEGALVSDRSSAYLWGLLAERPPTVEVAVANGRCRAPQGVCIHRRRLKRRDVRSRHGLPVTSPARTLLDLAGRTTIGELDRLIAEARVKRLLRPGELERAVDRSDRRPGTANMRALLKAEGQPGITRSEAERILRRMIRHAHLPQPRTNVKIGRYEADFVWAAERVVLEVDSWGFHGTRRAFERDRRKDLALQAAGYQVIRITATQLTDEPLAVIAQLARALDRAARARG